jgi:hypothetical protein
LLPSTEITTSVALSESFKFFVTIQQQQETIMLILKLDLAGRTTQNGPLIEVATALEGLCLTWQQIKDETRAETSVVNRHKIADTISHNIELAESLATALRLAADKYGEGEWATGENSIEIQV